MTATETFNPALGPADAEGVHHYGTVWNLSRSGLYEGVCDCGYRAPIRMTPGPCKDALEAHIERKTGQYCPAEVMEDRRQEAR